ncbi:hypothetical protein DVH05_017140 [Phytophthora capsici]|nr:hypothetical protein DVH05_017140 [Phytophthora capsici]
MDFKDIPVPKNYKSPLQRRDEKPNDANYRVLATSDAFKEFVAEKPTTTENVQIFARFIWSSAHTVKDGRRLLRLHLTDLFADESSETLLQRIKDNYEHNQYGVDQDLITATIFDAENTTEGLPAAGQKRQLQVPPWLPEKNLKRDSAAITKTDCTNGTPVVHNKKPKPA